MSQPVLTTEELGVWIAGLKVLFGTVTLAWALRHRDQAMPTTAPFGAGLLASGTVRLLVGRVPDRILTPVATLLLVTIAAWFVYEVWAERARRKARQRSASVAESR